MFSTVLKGIFHSKKTILSLFSLFHVIPNHELISSAEPESRFFLRINVFVFGHIIKVSEVHRGRNIRFGRTWEWVWSQNFYFLGWINLISEEYQKSKGHLLLPVSQETGLFDLPTSYHHSLRRVIAYVLADYMWGTGNVVHIQYMTYYKSETWI